MQLEEKIKRYALINAVEHGGKAAAGSVLGKILAEYLDMRDRVKELQQQIMPIVSEVNNLSREEQKTELKKLGGYEKSSTKEEKKLPELKYVEKVVVRFAPNPDGALHLGNARPAVLSYEYAKKYNGEFILRFDDTDPKVKRPEKIFYSWIEEDLKWLDIKWGKKIVASKRLKIYYDHAEKLIALGGAYVCTCGEEWKKMRDAAVACPCRELAVKEQQKCWKNMLAGKYKEGQAVLRVKTFLGASNPAVRDWPAMRIVDKPKHPLVKKARLWPLFNFASAVDDYLLGVTHILRGQEHATNEEKQKYLYRHFGWVYPKVIILGRFLTPEMVLSKSAIRKGIEERKFSGWDDPRLGTLRSLRRRGFQPQALKQLILDIGPKSNDITIAFENLAAYNKKIIDRIADRYFFVPHPMKIRAAGHIKTLKLHLHPERKAGFRKFSVGNTFYIDREDFEKFKGTEIRLIGLYNVILDEVCEITGTEPKQIKKIQWVPEKSFVKVDVIMPEGIVSGYGEKNLLKTKKNQIIQMERFGFCRIEKKTAKKITAVFGHR